MNPAPDPVDPWEVAVCGAGPTGLLLAGELAERGVRVVVLERDDAPSSWPKANGVVGAAAIELRKRGLLAGTGLRVVSPPRFQFGPLELRLGLGPGNPLHILPVPQRRLEEILEQRATSRGAEVRRGHEVLGFEQSDAEVLVTVGTTGATKEVRTRYLVGCDGARSAVRKFAGIGFPGFTSDEISRIARVIVPHGWMRRAGDGFEIPGVGHVVAMRPNRLPGGAFSIAPAKALDPSAPGDQYLISTHEPVEEEGARDELSVDELRASLRRVLGADLPFTDATALRSTVGNSRQADAYRVGRVFLAGDAAHLYNAGGSALNVGLQDAIDLAGRLAAVLRGNAPERELDQYETVRRPAGERVLQHTRAQAALGRDDESSRALRATFGELIASRGGARRAARMLESA